ncbi:hypothetical protein C6P40_002768 [Pichia californica]|uniref:Uncharacterized protein n=1 Tax=Pichia californica TaxID=460514 RepID=A0A9P6WHA3_9ASCO|nr:hypothetical protein C6P42_005186 [[Candida] californica]KAG0687174.1 hypothetical protein C6P40_002768 [[Candida] californica]
MTKRDENEVEFELFLNDWESYKNKLEKSFNESAILEKERCNVDRWCEEIDTIVDGSVHESIVYGPIMRLLISELNISQMNNKIGINHENLFLSDSKGEEITEEVYIKKRVKKVCDDFLFTLRRYGFKDIFKIAVKNIGVNNSIFGELMDLYNENQKPSDIEKMKSMHQWLIIRKGRIGKYTEDACVILSRIDELFGYKKLAQKTKGKDEVTVDDLDFFMIQISQLIKKLTVRQLKVVIFDQYWRFVLANTKPEYTKILKRAMTRFMNEELMIEDSTKEIDTNKIIQELICVCGNGNFLKDKMKILDYRAYDKEDKHRYAKIITENHQNGKRNHDHLDGDNYRNNCGQFKRHNTKP